MTNKDIEFDPFDRDTRAYKEYEKAVKSRYREQLADKIASMVLSISGFGILITLFLVWLGVL